MDRKGATSTTKLFRAERAGRNYDTNELLLWQRHVDREHLGSANLLANQLSARGDPGPSLSFLASSSPGSGGWEVSTLRRGKSTLMHQRLASSGTLSGPLQMATSASSLPALTAAATSSDDLLPADFALRNEHERSMRRFPPTLFRHDEQATGRKVPNASPEPDVGNGPVRNHATGRLRCGLAHWARCRAAAR